MPLAQDSAANAPRVQTAVWPRHWAVMLPFQPIDDKDLGTLGDLFEPTGDDSLLASDLADKTSVSSLADICSLLRRKIWTTRAYMADCRLQKHGADNANIHVQHRFRGLQDDTTLRSLRKARLDADYCNNILQAEEDAESEGEEDVRRDKEKKMGHMMRTAGVRLE